MDSHSEKLGIMDYALMGTMLTISSGIGVYFRFSGEKQQTTKAYLLAGKNMSIFPVAFSLMATFISATTIIGIPAEIYYFGIYMIYTSIGIVIGMVLAAYVTLPVFFEMEATTTYEYLEVRFGKTARVFTSLTFIVQMILCMSVVLYAPALALGAVTNLSTWMSVVSTGVVCTFYCTIGGMKAILWTDFFQSVLMFMGVFAINTVGFLNIGFENVYRIADEGGRIVIPEFDFSPYTRYTAWNIVFQGTILAISAYGANQIQVQRLLTVKSLRQSRKAIFLNIPISICFHFLTCTAGIVIYAYFARCDPMTPPNNPITKGDQLFPYFIMVSLADYPGLPGLCICGIFSASLSTISSAINSLSAVTMQDLIRPYLESRGVSQLKMTLATQATTLFFGFLCVALTFLVAHLGNVVQAIFTVYGILGGPALAIFLLGMLTIRANEKGSIIGMTAGILLSAWIGFGGSANGPRPKILPSSTEGCPLFNITTVQSSFISTTFSTPSTYSRIEFSTSPELLVTEESVESIINQLTETDDIFPLYKISYMWLTPIGFFASYIIGYIASIVINIITGKTEDVSQELISPILKGFYFKKSVSKIGGNIKAPHIQQGVCIGTNDCGMPMKSEENIKKYIIESSSL